MEQAIDYRDWCHELPAPAVDLISRKIICIDDHRRFRQVCSPWRRASNPKPRHLQLPWLMIPYNPDPQFYSRDKPDEGIRLFYDLWEKKMHKLHLPETIGMMCCATFRGWLLLVAIGGEKVLLLNPLTRYVIQLPPFTIPPKHDEKSHPKCNCASLRDWPNIPPFPIISVSFGDLTDTRCQIMIVFDEPPMTYICRVGDLCWTGLQHYPNSSDVVDATYHHSHGLVFLLRETAFSIIDPKKEGIRDFSFTEELRNVDLFFLHGKQEIYICVVREEKEEVDLEDLWRNNEHVKKDEDDSWGTEEDERDDTEDDMKCEIGKKKYEIYQFQEDFLRVIEMSDKLDSSHIFKKIPNISDTTIFIGEDAYHLSVCSNDWEKLEGGDIYKVDLISTEEFGCFTYGVSYSKVDYLNFEKVAGNIADVPTFTTAKWFQPSYV